MPSTSINRSSTLSAARMSLVLLLTVLLVFPGGIAWGQTACPNSWTTSPVALPPPPGARTGYGLETMAAAVNNNFLYVVGGYDYQDAAFQNQVSYVGLNSNGSLGSGFTSQNLWTDSATGQPAQLARYLCGVVNNGYLYTIGGATNEPGANPPEVTTNQIWFAHININGSLANWQQASLTGTIPPALQLAATVAVNNHLYIIGGSTATGTRWLTPSCCVVGHTYYAKIKSNGDLGQFAQGPDIPVNATYNKTGHLYKTCPVVNNGTIYVSGGENEATALQTVYYATPDPTTGSFPGSKWNQETGTSMLPATDAAQAVTLVNEDIILMGGDSSGSGTNICTVYQGVVNSTSSITWNSTNLSMLPVKVSRNAGATNNGYIYSLGGAVAAGPTDSPAINYLHVGP